ncbi:MAG: phosphohistidine phosphatase SixA [Candidatus Aureabacteria bacterium]|nr:phosphohistidine phosphatase SixA [Candidatus Auribacterota bacterium]
MKLYIIRHGDAVSKSTDLLRPLSEVGKVQSKKIGAFLNRLKIAPAIMMHSTKTRAEQTANIISEKIGYYGPVNVREELSPDYPIDIIAKEILESNEDTVIIGHLPFLSYLTSYLLSKKDGTSFCDFNEATVICLEKNNSNKKFYLVYSVSPDLLED